MNRLLFWGGLAGVAACFVRPTFATITPDWGYVDGCTDILLQGHHLGTTATAQIGGVDVQNLAPAAEDPNLGEHAQDVGFLYTARTPPAASGAAGWADVTLTVDGETFTKPETFYYQACPASFQVDHFSLPDGGAYGYTTVGTGQSISFDGCGLDADVTVRFMRHADPGTGTTGLGTGTTFEACGGYPLVEAATTTLVSDCSSAYVHADVPALAAGTYDVWLTHTDGTTYTGGVFPHTADTGVSCFPIQILAGGA